MKISGIRWSILMILIFCGATFSQIHPHSRLGYKTNLFLMAEGAPPAVTASGAIGTQDPQPVIVSLNSGEIAEGSIPAPAVANDCLLGNTQYRIEFPGGALKLLIELEGNQDIDLYVRRGALIALEEGKILSDFKSDSPRTTEKLSLPSFVSNSDFSAGTPLLEPGTYFIAITNCGPGAAGYKLSARIINPPDAETLPIDLSSVEVGSVLAADPGFCKIGRTQYTASAFFNPCSGGFSWIIVIRADQNVKVYVRKNNPVTVENGVVIFDRVSESQAKTQFIQLSEDTPGLGLYFIAIENCSSDVANYTVTPFATIADVFPPLITNAFFKKKNLHVVGHLFSEGWVVLLDGQPQETIFGGRTGDSQDVLIVKKAKKKIARRQAVRITLKKGECTSSTFLFVRP